MADEISDLNAMLKTSSDIIQKGNTQLKAAMAKDVLFRTEVRAAHAKIDIGLERKRKCESQIAVLEKRRKLLS